jgi:hypothetical protein
MPQKTEVLDLYRCKKDFVPRRYSVEGSRRCVIGEQTVICSCQHRLCPAVLIPQVPRFFAIQKLWPLTRGASPVRGITCSIAVAGLQPEYTDIPRWEWKNAALELPQARRRYKDMWTRMD